MRPFLLALITITLAAAADTGPDIAVARSAFGVGASHRATLFDTLGIIDDKRIRVASGVATVGADFLTITATDLASGNAITEMVDHKQSREPFPVPLSDGRTAMTRVVRPSIGPAIVVIVSINDPPKPAKAAP